MSNIDMHDIVSSSADIGYTVEVFEDGMVMFKNKMEEATVFRFYFEDEIEEKCCDGICQFL